MSTRGALGFRINGTDKITYNHSDSYPEGLGKSVVEWCRNVTDWKDVKKKVLKMKKVEGVPTKEKDQLCDMLGLTGRERDWYWILRETQGDLDKILEAKYYEDYKIFLHNSLFCEYAYIINFDLMELEIYVGSQRQPHNQGRYANKKSGDERYFPVALVGTFDLTDIPEDWMERCGFITEEA